MSVNLSPEQRRNVRTILRVGRRRGASRKQLKAALETGLVESSFRNLPGGEGTSQGWRQETASSYPNVNRRNVAGAAGRFFDEAARADRGQPSGSLAQDVQRSAFPDRYAGKGREAGALLRQFGRGKTASRTATRSVSQETTPAIDALRRQLAVTYFAQRGRPGALLELGSGLQQIPQEAAQSNRRAIASGSETSASDRKAARITRRAEKVSEAAPPYKWGGGHGARPAKLGSPVDCSGAVSQVLKINPRVSGQMESVGKPGRGRVNLYYSGSHTFLEMNGHFWGTSRSNPDGGAGWIPRSQVSRQYLRGFKVRHVA